MYLISGNITSNVTGNLLVITGNGNIGNITSNFRTLVVPVHECSRRSQRKTGHRMKALQAAEFVFGKLAAAS